MTVYAKYETGTHVTMYFLGNSRGLPIHVGFNHQSTTCRPYGLSAFPQKDCLVPTTFIQSDEFVDLVFMPVNCL